MYLRQHKLQLEMKLGELNVYCNHGAAADDLTLFARSREGLQRLADGVTEFLELHSIKANVNKTEHLVLGRQESPEWKHNKILLQGVGVSIIRDESYTFRILGVHMNIEGNYKRVLEKFYALTRQYIATIRTKVINPKIFRYLVSAVLLPRLLYRLHATNIPLEKSSNWDKSGNCHLPPRQKYFTLHQSTEFPLYT